MQLAIITVVYKNYDVLKDFFSSLEEQTDSNFQVFLSDLTENPEAYNYPHFVHVTHSGNGGYAHGVNIGLRKAIERGFGEFCVINNDTYIKEDFVKNALASLSKHSNTLIGGKIYYAPGFEFRKDLYKTKDIGQVLWYAGGAIDWDHATVTHRGVDEVDHGQYDKKSKTGFITGCMMCFDHEVIDRVGFWDEEYFLYYEDTDYCVRAQKKGISLVYDPSLLIWHKNAQSTKGPGSSIHRKYQEKNRLLFGMKYAPLKTKLHLMKNYFVRKLTQ